MQSAKPWQRFALLIVLALGGFALTGLSGQKGAPVATAFANDRITPVAAQAAVPVTLAPDTDVAMFTPRNGQWPSASLKDVKPGGEFIYQDHLYRVTDSGTVEMVPDVDVSKLPDADRAFDKSNHRFPEAADVLMVLDKDMKFTHHAVLGTLKPGIRACFQGKAYELRAGRTAGTMDIADTGIVSARVTKTFQHTGENAADTLIDHSGLKEVVAYLPSRMREISGLKALALLAGRAAAWAALAVTSAWEALVWAWSALFSAWASLLSRAAIRCS